MLGCWHHATYWAQMKDSISSQGIAAWCLSLHPAMGGHRALEHGESELRYALGIKQILHFKDLVREKSRTVNNCLY